MKLRQKLTINIKGKLMDLSSPRIMGILNITPDSFFDGGHHNEITSALKQTEKMLMEGADIIDIGSYSSRPDAENISAEEEIDRLLPVLRSIHREFPQAPVSIDTFRSEVARAAVAEGAHIINDISGGQLDPAMFQTVAELKAPYILMHMKGTPQNMKQHAQYEDVVTEVLDYFIEKTQQLTQMGVYDVIIDPGFGFAKTNRHNYALLNKLEAFDILGLPLLIGVSRKSMIWKTLDITPNEALNGTTVANTIALMKGANILRVHDVKAAAEAINIVSHLQAD